MSSSQFPTEFGSTKNKHVKGNSFVNDFVYTLDQPQHEGKKEKSKFVPRAKRLAAKAQQQQNQAEKQ